MPGFSIGPGGDIPPPIEVKRVHRWVFTAPTGVSELDKTFLLLKTAARPKITFIQDEVHHKQEVIYLAGKQTWEPIELTFYDVEQEPNSSVAIFDWLETITDLFDGSLDVGPPDNYKKTCTLEMKSGADSSESWSLYNCWPASVSWGDLDYTSTDLATISVTMRYDRAVKDL